VDEIPTPTPRELEILKVLWERGPSTVREVYLHRFQAEGVAQNTVQSMLRLMAERKKLVSARLEGRNFIYTAAFSRDESAARYLDSVFDGAASEMVMSLLRSERIPPAELEAMRTMIDQARSRGGRRHG
jgi:BlaI family transcriptional regulator, penicillinase repressor